MNIIRPLIIFAGKTLLIYILLITAVNFTKFDSVYRNMYLHPASAIASIAYKNANIKCEKYEDSKSGDDIIFTFANQSTIEKATKEAQLTGKAQTSIKGFKWSFNTYRVELIFVLFLISLTLAYSSKWKYKIKSFLFSLAIYFVLSSIFFLAEYIHKLTLIATFFLNLVYHHLADNYSPSLQICIQKQCT